MLSHANLGSAGFSSHLLPEICRIPDQFQAECYADPYHKHFFLFLGCARSNQQCLTVVPNQKEFLWTQAFEIGIYTSIAMVYRNHFLTPMLEEKPHAPKWQASGTVPSH